MHDAVALPVLPLVDARVEMEEPVNEGKLAEQVADPVQLRRPPAQVVAQVGVPVGSQTPVAELHTNVAAPVRGVVTSVTFSEDPNDDSVRAAEQVEMPSAPSQFPTDAAHLTSPCVMIALGCAIAAWFTKTLAPVALVIAPDVAPPTVDYS